MSGICPPVPILPKRIGLIDHLNSTQLHCIMFVLNCRHCTLHSDQLSWQHAPIDFHGCPPLMRLFGGASTCPSIRHNLVSFRVNLTSPVCVFVTPLRSTGSCRLICSRGTPNTQAFMALRWGGGGASAGTKIYSSGFPTVRRSGDVQACPGDDLDLK